MVQLIEVHSDLRISDLYRLFFHERDSKTDLCEMGSDHRFNPSRCLGNTICRFCSPPHGASVPVPFARRPYFRSCCLAYLRSRAFVRATMGASSTLSCAIGQLGVDVRRHGSQAHYDWEAVRNTKQTSSLIVIYVDGLSTLVIPKRCFASSQQVDEVRSIIAAYAKSKVKKHDYWP